MPFYDYSCSKCSKIFNTKISIDMDLGPKDRVAKLDYDMRNVKCEICGNLMEQFFDIEHAPNFQFKGPQPVGRAGKQNRQTNELIELSNQVPESVTEIQAGLGMAAEMEKQKGLTPGTLTTGVKAISPNDKKAFDTVKKRDLKKKNEAVRLRKKNI